MFTFLAATAIKSAMIFALAWAIVKIMRRTSAAARHLVWTSAMAVAVFLPLLSAPTISKWIPTWNVPAPAAWRITVTGTDSVTKAQPHSGPADSHQGTAARENAFPNWRTAIAWLWATGTSAALLQMLFGSFSVWRLQRSLRKRERVAGVDIFESPAGTMPMAAGIWKPAVFLPGDAAGWPEERRRAVLAHELAHVQRGDAATQFLARTAVALYWWNPLAWMAWREFLKERERAADDLVLASGVNAPDYAEHLLQVARQFAGSPAMGVAMARNSQLEGRLLAILDSNVSRKGASRSAALAAAACALAIMAPLAAVRAQENSALPADVQATIRSAQSQHDPAMLEKIAGVAEGQRNFDVARKLLEAAVEIHGEISGKSSAEYGRGLLKLAELDWRQHGLSGTSPALYSQAADMLQSGPDAALALVRLGEIALANKDVDSAAALFQRARTSDPTKAAKATLWLADVRARQGNLDEADELYKTAIAAEDPKSVDAAIATSMYASFLKKHGRADESAGYLDQAKQLYAANVVRPRPSASAVSAPYQIGGAVSAPRVLSKLEPEYSEEARMAALQGTVVMSIVVGEDGIAHDILVTRSLGMGLDGKAIEAVSQWRFQPGTKDGQPVPVIATIEVNFRLL